MNTTTQPDPNEGHGGSYELDPATGQRRLLHRTEAGQPTQEQPAQPEPTAAPAGEPNTDNQE